MKETGKELPRRREKGEDFVKEDIIVFWVCGAAVQRGKILFSEWVFGTTTRLAFILTAWRGLLAWAADVVGAHGNNHELEEDRIPIVLTDDQRKYVQELDSKVSSLSRTIHDLRLRLPPPDISQRLPHILAHSLASNADLALQLNAHSATKEQAQLREVTLQEENAAYEKALLNCENNILERMQEADLLLRKLQEMDETEQTLMEELENAETERDARQHGNSGESVNASETTVEAGPDAEAAKSDILEKLDNKKKELSSMEEIVQDLEKRWMQVQENALKQPTPGFEYQKSS
ncbi:hypothetical protein OIU84_028781 [Salix udensis]|uniref:Uncharacterized protein n=1 Tax=Salix udensis TaxID=889485 RepID=A0AAD6KEV0_9ROSI|nr:hypothetical protein OIU84_028781 [Salix udensis]